MESSKWDFNAPTFIDFSNNEHLSTDLDHFFDHGQSDDAKQGLSSPSLQNSVQQSPQELSLDVAGQAYNVPTPNRQTYFVPTPSRVLRSRLRNKTSSGIDNSIKLENNDDCSKMKRCGLAQISKFCENEPKKSNASIIQESIEKLSSIVSSVPKKKVKLTLPRTPKFASNSSKTVETKSKHVKIQSQSFKHNKHQSFGVNAERRRSWKVHDMVTRLDVSLDIGSPATSVSEGRLKKSLSAKNTSTKLADDIKNCNNMASSIANLAPKRRKTTGKSLFPAKTFKKTATVPAPFSFSTDKRATRQSVVNVTEQSKLFRATPVPPSLYKKPKFIKNVKSLNITVPVSPAFASKNCLKRKVTHEDDASSIKKPKLQNSRQSVPKSSVFKPKLAPIKTVPRPFLFETREREKFLKKKEKMKELNKSDAVAVKFKAQSAPTTFSSLPPRQVKKPTLVKPFQLHRGKTARLNAGKEVAKKNEETDENLFPKFKANRKYKKILKQKPWKPNLEQKHSTRPLQPVFHSQARMVRRTELKKNVDTVLHELDKSVTNKENASSTSLQTKSGQFVANIPHKNKAAKHSKFLTVPTSPNFAKRLKKH